jgi:hypothetical protein
MPAKQLKAKYRRKMGEQYFVVNCPDCNRRHWIKAGPYTADPTLALGVRELPCGYTATIIPDKPLMIDMRTDNRLAKFRAQYPICKKCSKVNSCQKPCDAFYMQ